MAPELESDPALLHGQLPNGLRYVVMHQAQPAAKLSLRLRIAAGSLFETDAQRGLAHYLEHMAFNGTGRFPPGELVRRLQSAGLAFGAHTNAHTSFDETVYKLDLPDTKPETVALALDALADQAGAMLLLPTEVDRERGVILAEMRDRDGADQRIWKRSAATTYAGTLIADRLPIGTAETVSAATPALLRDFYERWYEPKRMILAAVGDIDPAVFSAEIAAHFASLAARHPAEADPPLGHLEPSTAVVPLVVTESEASDTGVSFQRVRERARPVDSAASRRAQFLADLAEEILGQRIARLVEQTPTGPLLGGGPFSYQRFGCYHAGVQGMARPGQAAAALRVLVEEYRRMLAYGPTPGELAATISAQRARLDAAIERAGSRPNAALAGAIVDVLGDDRAFRSPAQDRALEGGFLADATVETVRDAARAAWGDGGRVVALATGRDPGATPAELAALGDWSAPVAKPAELAEARWAYPAPATALAMPLPEPVEGVYAFTVGDHGTVPALVRPSSAQPGSVLAQLRFQIKPFPYQAGVAELASRAFLAGGLGRHDADQLRRILSPTSIALSGPRVDEDGIVFSISCRPADFSMACVALAAQISDPGWRAEPLGRILAAWRDELTAASSDLDQQTMLAFNRSAAGNAPWRRPATLDELAALDLGRMRAWLEPILTTAPASIAVAGDLAPGEAIATIRSAFAEVARGRQAPVVVADASAAQAALPEGDPWTPGVVELTVPGKVARDLVVVAWPTGDTFDIRAVRRRQLLADGIEDRLRERLREELGQAYSPSCWIHASQGWKGWGYLAIAASVAHGQAKTAVGAIDAVMASVRADGIDQDTFERSRTPVIANLLASKQRNDWWLEAALGRGAIQPFRLQWVAERETDFRAITREEINGLARQLDEAKRITVVGACPGE
jgi:zinc protease